MQETMEKLQIQMQQHGPVTLFVLGGSLDTDTSPQFDALLAEQIEAGRLYYVLDLDTLEYISSAGIGVLVGTLNQLQEMGGDLRLVHLPPKIARILEMLALLELFMAYPDLPSALNSFR